MVKIVTDSASDIPSRLAEELDISVVPARVLFGRHSYRDGVDLSASEFYYRLQNSYYHPLTTQAAPLDYYRVFRRIERMNEDILCISVPKALSALIESAQIAAEQINKVNIEVISAGGISGYQAIIVLVAAQMAKDGYDIDSIIHQVEELKPETRLYSVAATLDYLKRGGRISSARYQLGTLLGVLPIVTVEDEKLINADQQLFNNMEKAIDKIINRLRSEYSGDQPLICFVLHAQNISGASMFADKLETYFTLDNLITTRIGATIGANIGPGALGVAVAPSVPFIEVGYL